VRQCNLIRRVQTTVGAVTVGAAAAAKENYTIREAGADYVLGVIWSPQETTLT